ncbi:hypothetical protein PS720_01317 [Pseudomonas fluorescens]|nr:hypothetical protein SAMN05428951_109161 [Pseudomonas sp. OV546]VVN83940.1 hypothetical protein PS720_01317 [Pseudomonas fluorescens]
MGRKACVGFFIWRRGRALRIMARLHGCQPQAKEPLTS